MLLPVTCIWRPRAMALRLADLRKDYIAPDGSVVPVIDIAEMSVGDGEHVALIGTSGSGKTTLLHMIAGIVAADSGHILYDQRGPGAPPLDLPRVPDSSSSDTVLNYKSKRTSPETSLFPPGVVDLTRLSEADRDVFRGAHVGYIFQTHHLLGGFTALENVLLGMSFTGRKPDRPWAKRLLDEVGLTNRADYKPEKLSVGQQQRVAVA